jgi:hypothetical protein
MANGRAQHRDPGYVLREISRGFWTDKAETQGVQAPAKGQVRATGIVRGVLLPAKGP